MTALKRRKVRAYQLRKKYNLTIAEVGRMRVKQHYGCAICRQIFSKTPHVDHDHETGEVRGLLCSRCNTRLGVLEDTDFVRAARKFLREHKLKSKATAYVSAV